MGYNSQFKGPVRIWRDRSSGRVWALASDVLSLTGHNSCALSKCPGRRFIVNGPFKGDSWLPDADILSLMIDVDPHLRGMVCKCASERLYEGEKR